MIRNIIFDFGAVLVDWNPKYLYAPYFNDEEKLNYFLETVCPYTWNTTVDAGRDTEEAMSERIALYPEWEKEILMYYRNWIGMMGDHIEGMLDIVKALKDKGYRLYGLSNWSKETFPLIVDNYEVFTYLEGYVVSGFEGVKKPSPEIYQILLDRYQIKAEESIFIDDSPANIEAGEAQGIKGILFTDAESLRAQLESSHML